MSSSADGHMYLTLAVVAARKEQKTKVRSAITNTKQNGIDKRKAKKQNERIFFRRSGSVIKEMGRGGGGVLARCYSDNQTSAKHHALDADGPLADMPQK